MRLAIILLMCGAAWGQATSTVTCPPDAVCADIVGAIKKQPDTTSCIRGAMWGQQVKCKVVSYGPWPTNYARVGHELPVFPDVPNCENYKEQQADKHSVRKDPRNFVDAPPITQTRDIPAGDPAVMNIVTKPGCEATVENGNIIVAPTKAEDHQADTTSNVTAIVTCPPDRMCDARTGKPIDQPKPDTTSCIIGSTCPGTVIGQPEASGYVEITESDGKMHRVCPKYQHVEPTMFEIDCGIDASRNCTPHCVDDIHAVTEREFQEIMARLNKLEHPYTAEELQHMREILARLKALESRK